MFRKSDSGGKPRRDKTDARKSAGRGGNVVLCAALFLIALLSIFGITKATMAITSGMRNSANTALSDTSKAVQQRYALMTAIASYQSDLIDGALDSDPIVEPIDPSSPPSDFDDHIVRPVPGGDDGSSSGSEPGSDDWQNIPIEISPDGDGNNSSGDLPDGDVPGSITPGDGVSTNVPEWADRSDCSDWIYIVKRGDTLSVISGKVGYSVDELAEYNQIANVHRIYVGQAIRVPMCKNRSDSD